MLRIQVKNFNVFPFTQQEAEEFKQSFAEKSELLEVVKVADQSEDYYMIYSNLQRKGYFDKNGFFHTDIQLHI